VNLDVGPVAPASALAWIEWAQETLGELRAEPVRRASLSADMLDEVGHYLEAWTPRNGAVDESLRWRADIDPEELEYLVHAFYTLDAWLSADVQRGRRSGVPGEGRVFYLVLVRALLHALETESPGRAAFVDQLRSSWPSAAAAG
jgi:hypothetical protein